MATNSKRLQRGPFLPMSTNSPDVPKNRGGRLKKKKANRIGMSDDKKIINRPDANGRRKALLAHGLVKI